MPDEYASRQPDRDRQYRDSWQTPEAKAWLDSMSSEKRREMETQGLLAPMLPKDGCANGCGVEDDVADSPEASMDAASVPGTDSLDAILADYPHLEGAIEERAMRMAGGAHREDILRRLALLFIDRGRRALNADCLAYVSGLSLRMGESGTSLAQKHGISRQAFHKRCSELMRELGLPPSRAMKSVRARHSYRISNRRWGSSFS